MITNFADHSSNERTFLSWIRTALTLAGFGIILDKLPSAGGSSDLSGLSFALLTISAILVLLSTIRFLIIRREIASPASSDRRFAVFETSFVLVLSTLLIAIAVFGYLAIRS